MKITKRDIWLAAVSLAGLNGIDEKRLRRNSRGRIGDNWLQDEGNNRIPRWAAANEYVIRRRESQIRLDKDGNPIRGRMVQHVALTWKGRDYLRSKKIYVYSAPR